MSKRDTQIALGLSLGLMMALMPFAIYQVDPLHDGVTLKPALDVLSGMALFRDTFMQYGALTCYLHVLALWVFPSLLSVKLLTVAAYGVSVFFLYASWRMILPRALVVLACSMFIIFIPSTSYTPFYAWSSVLAVMFQSIGIYSLFKIIRGEQPELWGCVLGIAFACIFWCRQPVGIVVLGCLAIIWVALNLTGWTLPGRSKKVIFAWIILGFLLVNLSVLCGIVSSGALPEWWYQNFVWPGKWAKGVDGQFAEGYLFKAHIQTANGVLLLLLALAAALPRILKERTVNVPLWAVRLYYALLIGIIAWHQLYVKHGGGWSVVIVLAIIVQLLISARDAFGGGSKPRSTEYYMVAALAVLSFGSIGQYLPKPDVWHTVWSQAPAFGLLIFMLSRWLKWRASVLILVMTGIFVPVIVTRGLDIRREIYWVSRSVTLKEPLALGGMRLPIEQAEPYEVINKAISRVSVRNPRISGILFGDNPIYLCFFKNLENPTPYYVTWKGLAKEDEGKKRLEYIQRARPLIICELPTKCETEWLLHQERYETIVYIDELKLKIAAPRELL